MNWFKRMFTIPKARKQALRQTIDKDIDSIFEHNKPGDLANKITEYVQHNPVAAVILLLDPSLHDKLQDILARNSMFGARQQVKDYIHARLGL